MSGQADIIGGTPKSRATRAKQPKPRPESRHRHFINRAIVEPPTAINTGFTFIAHVTPEMKAEWKMGRPIINQ